MNSQKIKESNNCKMPAWLEIKQNKMQKKTSKCKSSDQLIAHHSSHSVHCKSEYYSEAYWWVIIQTVIHLTILELVWFSVNCCSEKRRILDGKPVESRHNFLLVQVKVAYVAPDFLLPSQNQMSQTFSVHYVSSTKRAQIEVDRCGASKDRTGPRWEAAL